MPLYRIVIEGTGIRTHRGAAGFFSTRTVTQPTRQAAEMAVMRMIREDWRSGPSANLSPTKPALRVVDSWPVKLFARLKRIPDTSYRYYTNDNRDDVARIEAGHIRAPSGSPIWDATIATASAITDVAS